MSRQLAVVGQRGPCAATRRPESGAATTTRPVAATVRTPAMSGLSLSTSCR
jgi:hypothetical protein